MNKQNRDALKQYFTTGKTPTQGQFAELIDSGINLIEDGLTVDEKGNVGIGNANPLAKLDVAGNVAALAFQGDGSAIRNLRADQITSGTLDPSRLPTLDASKITTGVIDPARLPAMGSGTIDAARIPALDASKIATGKLIVQVIPNLDASLITSGYLSPDRLAPKPTWQPSIARPGGNSNTARCLIDFANLVHLTGSVDPIFSQLTGGTRNLLRMPRSCVPVESQFFVILDNHGEPWRLEIPAAPDQDVGASYLGTATVPGLRTLYLTGLSYANAAQQATWLATISRPGGSSNSVRCLLDSLGLVRLIGAVNPAFSMLLAGTDDLLEIPAHCTPCVHQIFMILDNRGAPWQLIIPATPAQRVSAKYAGKETKPIGRTLYLTGLTYTMTNVLSTV